jgi:hypothetical protein
MVLHTEMMISGCGRPYLVDDKVVMLGGQIGQVGALQAHVVVVVHLVHDDDRVAPGEQRIRHMAADEARSARHQHLSNQE